MIRSASVVPTSRPFSRTSTANGAFTASQPDTGPAVAVDTGASTDEVTPAWMMTRCFTARAAIGLEHDLVVARREVGDADRRDAVVDAVDADPRARRIRLHQQAAGRRRFGQLEILRRFRARGHGDVEHARHAAAAQLDDVRAGVEREARRRVAVRDAVDEHRDARRIGLQREGAELGRWRLAQHARRIDAAADERDDRHAGDGHLAPLRANRRPTG